jgi:hypothetical protein
MVRRANLRIDEASAKTVLAARSRDFVGTRKIQEELTSVRCPLCRGVLIARQGRAGPYFHCRCVGRVKNGRP